MLVPNSKSSFFLGTLLVCCLVFEVANAQTPAGRVEFALGAVEIEAKNGNRRAARRGARVFSGETIETKRGRAQVRFADRSRISLTSNTRFEVEQYAYEPDARGNANSLSKSFFNLVRGGVRVLTGLIGKSDKKQWRMRTAAATIGIRGTHFRVSFIDNVLLVAVGIEPGGVPGQGVEIGNALGNLAAGPGENVEVVLGEPPKFSDAQPILLDEAAALNVDVDLAANEIRNGNDLAISTTDSTASELTAAGTFVGGSASSVGPLVSNHVAVTLLGSRGEALGLSQAGQTFAFGGIRDNATGEVLSRTTASIQDVQIGTDWALFRFENGDVSSLVGGTGSTTTLPAPHGSIMFAVGERTTSIPATGFIDFNTVTASLPTTTDSMLDSVGLVKNTALNVFYDGSAGTITFSSMNVEYLGTPYNVSGAPLPVVAAVGGTGFIFHGNIDATGGAGACFSLCGATVGGAFIGNQSAPLGDNIPTGLAVTGTIDESPERIQFGAILGESNTSGL